jgi:hypothetical protein
MQRSIEIINGARSGDELIGRGLIGAAGIGEGGGGGFEAIEIANARFVGDGEHDDVTAFFAAADGEHAHARGRGGECTAVSVSFGAVDEFARRAGDAAEKFLG